VFFRCCDCDPGTADDVKCDTGVRTGCTLGVLSNTSSGATLLGGDVEGNGNKEEAEDVDDDRGGKEDKVSVDISVDDAIACEMNVPAVGERGGDVDG